MGSCLLLPRNDDLCEQQLLIHGQGHAVPKSGVNFISRVFTLLNGLFY